MANGSSAMELRVLINILQSGAGLQSILKQVNQVSAALTALQTQANAGGGAAAAGISATAATNATQLAAAANAAGAGLAATGRGANAALAPLQALDTAVNKLVSGFRLLTGGFLAYQSVRIVKSWADAAARAETLATVLHVVARNSGISVEAIDKLDNQVQKLGITAASSRQSITNMLSAGLDVTKAPLLARAAQDLAVIMGTDSSFTLQRMVINIQQLDTVGLKWMGLVIDRERAEKKFADSVGKTGQALSKTEQQAALMNAVLEKSAEFAGVYETAMGNVGKQIQSLERLSTNLKKALGDILLPAYSAIVEELSLFYREAELTAIGMQRQGRTAEELAVQVRAVARALREVAEIVMNNIGLIMSAIKLWVTWKAALYIAPAVLTGLETLLGLMIRIVAVATAGKIAWLNWQAGATGAAVATAELTTTMTVLSKLPMVVIFSALGIAILDIGRGLRDANEAFENGAFWKWFRQVSSQGAGMAGASYTGIGSLPPGLQQMVAAKMGMMPRPGSEKEEGGGDAVDKARLEAWEAMGVTQAATRRFTAAQVPSTPLGELQAADAALKAAKDNEDKKTAAYRDLTKKTVFVDKARQEYEDTQLKAFENAKQLGVLLGQLSDAQKELFGQAKGFDPTTGKPFTQDAAQKASALQNIIDITRKVVERSSTGKAPITLTQSFKDMGNQFQEGIKAIAQAAKEPLDIEKLRTGLVEYRKLAEEAGVTQKRLAEIDAEGREALEVARLGVRGATRAFGQPSLEEAKRKLKDQSDAVTQVREQALDEVKLFNQREAAEDEAKYKLGTIKMNEFYDRRLERLNREAVANERVALQRIRTLELQRPTTYGENLPALQNQINQAQDALANQREAVNEQARANERERLTAREDLVREIRAGRLEHAASLGGVAEALAVINNKYDEQLRLVKDGSIQFQAIQDQRRKDTFGVVLQFQNDKIEEQQKHLEQVVEFEQRRIDLASARGELSPTQLAREQNELIRLRIEGTQRIILAEKERLKIQQEQIRLDTEAGLNTDALEKAATETTNKIVLLTQTTAEMAEEVTKYGKELRKVFEESLGEALTDLITRTKDATEAIIDFWKAVERQIAGTFMKELAARITAAIVKVTTTTDKKTGEPVTIFDRIFKLFGLGTKSAIPKTEEAAIKDLQRPLGSSTDPVFIVSTSEDKAYSQSLQSMLPKGLIPGLSGGDFGKVMNFASDIMGLFKRTPGRGAFGNMGPLAGVLPGGLPIGIGMAVGGPVTGPGTGTSDSVPAMVSAGEHIMPAAKAARWMPLLEGIRLGKLSPSFALGGVVALQSIAPGSIIPRRYAGGGVVVADGGASAVQTGGGGGGMVVSLHPDALNMSMREWLEHEVVRQHGRR